MFRLLTSVFRNTLGVGIIITKIIIAEIIINYSKGYFSSPKILKQVRIFVKSNLLFLPAAHNQSYLLIIRVQAVIIFSCRF